MTLSLQLAFPSSSGTFFDHDYCFGQHQEILRQHMGQYVHSVFVTKGATGPSGQPAPFHAIATLTFTGKSSLEAALAASGPVIADFANFTDATPVTQFGEIVIDS